MSRGPRPAAVALAALLAGAAGAGAARAAPPPAGVAVRATITPAPALLGQSLVYRGIVTVPPGVKVRFDPPASRDAFTWGAPHAGWSHAAGIAPDTAWIEAPLQVFQTGPVRVPGPAFTLDPAPGSNRTGRATLPVVGITILPTVTPADSNAQLRPLRGPLPAPWWERVPWRWVAAGLLALAVAIALARALRRRRPAAVPAPRPAGPPRRLDPATAALEALAALRAERLPEQGRFGEHALGLTRILRRFLEATVGTPRPGDTSGELVARLKDARLPDGDLERLDGLLGLWDRVKFARAPLSVEEARRCEQAVEGLVRRAQAAAAGRPEAA